MSEATTDLATGGISAQERRQHRRAPVGASIFACLGGQTVRLNDISQNGVAICGAGLAAGSRHLLEVHIGGQHLALVVEIIDTAANRLHGRFIEPDERSKTLINQYIGGY